MSGYAYYDQHSQQSSSDEVTEDTTAAEVSTITKFPEFPPNEGIMGRYCGDYKTT